MKFLVSFSFGVAFIDITVGHLLPRASCGVSSVYSALSSASTGSAFCSTLLYPNGPSTVTESTTDTQSCKTKTITEVETSTTTDTKTKSTTLPSIPVTIYSSTVLIPSGSHRSVNKRLAEAASASASAAGYQQCSPTPSAICGCPSQSISAACSSLVTSPAPVTSTTTIIPTDKCPKNTITITSTKIKTEFIGTYTETIYPAPDLTFTSATLTTTVPAACASDAYIGHGNGDAEDLILLSSYPDYPQTAVECCVACYNSDRYPNCVASAFISGSLECQLLSKVNVTAGEPTSKKCPNGIENYPFKQPHKKGTVYPGPCGY